MKIVMIGRTNVLLKTANLLQNKGHEIKLIITSKESTSDNSTVNDFKKLAKNLKSKFHETNNVNDKKIKNLIAKESPDIGISVNNPLLIKKDIIDLFKFGILNAHSGDLPKFRGNACPNWAILTNSEKIGMTIHFMDEKLDSGDIVIKKYFKILPETTILDFYEHAQNEYPKLFLDSINKIQKKNYHPKKQSSISENILRSYPRNKFDGKINWNNNPKQICNLIRASGAPFFGAYTYFDSKKMFVLESSIEIPKIKFLSEPGQVVERRKNGDIAVACNRGFLIIKKIKYNDIILSSPTKLIKTIHTRFGMNLEEEIEKILKKLDL